ncbi:MAG TPA: hypothetical protein VGF94_19600 [Kofleriaceae bacterium]|jgi:hypothetical protein
MVRIRSGWVVALAVLGLGASACKKNDDKGAASGDKTAEHKPGGGGAGDKGGGGGGGVANDDLALLPVDSEAVVGINFGQLQQSELWKEFVAPKLTGSDFAGIQKFKDLCGFDPLESLKTVSFGLKGLGGSGDDVNGVIVVHGYDKAKSMSCFDKDGVTEAEKDGTKVNIDGDVVLITDKKGKQIGFTFVNDTTAIAVLGPDATTKDGIKKIAAGGGSLAKSQTVVDLYGKIKTADSLWFLVNGNAPFMSKAGSLGVKPKAVFGSLNVTDGLSLDLHMRLNTPDEAGNLVSMAKGQLGQAKQFFDKIDVTNDGADVLIAIAMSKDKLKSLVGMMAGMMGGMMGGGAGGGLGQ